MTRQIIGFKPRGYDTDRIYKIRDSRWDIRPLLTECRPPIPRFTVFCPICQSYYVCIKHFQVFERDRQLREYRCDVWLKCLSCGHVWVHGLHLKPEEYELLKSIGCIGTRDWRRYGHICQDT